MTTVTIGSTTYTTYSSLVEADAYFNASTQYAAWAAYSDDAKRRGLVSSTRLIDRQAWQGEKVVASPEQELDFGRTGLYDRAGNSLTGDETLAMAVEASQLLALDLMAGDNLETEAVVDDRIKTMKAGSVMIEKFPLATLGRRFPLDVMELLGFFLNNASALANSIATGTDGEALDIDYALNSGI